MQLGQLHGFIFLLAIHFAIANRLGICVFSTNVTKEKYEFDRAKHRWNLKTYAVPVEHQGCCEGYIQSNPISLPLLCSPVCEPPCKNADCMAPNICVCHPGHEMINNSTTSCYDVCDACVNGLCHEDEDECTCEPGYERDETFKHICNPICSPSCVNATCDDPGKCNCFEGFTKDPDHENVCIPKCTEDCIFGTCTDPEVCTCVEGYINDYTTPSICLPECNQTCENGFCAKPNVCECRYGYELHPRNPFQCVSKSVENSSLNFCELNMVKAVKYDLKSDCFIMKENIRINGDAQCQPLKVLSLPSCSQPQSCGTMNCVLNFRCSAKRFNGTNEIHCYLETDDFETDENNTTLNSFTNWTDVTLVVNSFLPINITSMDQKKNQTREWSLRPLSKWPICGSDHFAVEIANCNRLTSKTGALTPPMNSTVLTWISVFLTLGFLLLVGVGIGGFLWARHRRLNDPLNYRENMMRGYNNESYNTRSVELVSDDDESEEETDAPL